VGGEAHVVGRKGGRAPGIASSTYIIKQTLLKAAASCHLLYRQLKMSTRQTDLYFCFTSTLAQLRKTHLTEISLATPRI